jgi:hypothetical protein
MKDKILVPSESQDDVCDYKLARNLVMLTAALACETDSGLRGERQIWTATLRDFAIRPFTLD